MSYTTQKEYCRFINEEIDTLAQQFIELPMDLTEDTYIHSDICSSRNQFSNIKASDNNWIRISSGYINASYVLGNYIATQYPLRNTIEHFWNLIFETESKVIINLTGNMKYLKCPCKYQLKLISYDNNNSFCECYQMIISNGVVEKNIHYLNFKTWIDNSVPTIEDFSRLLDTITMLEKLENVGPIVVHCMAGVGRTGTFIMIHNILKNIQQKKYKNPIDVVKEMRRTRANMIQTDEQFKFCLVYIHTKLTTKKQRRQLSSSCGLELPEKLISGVNPLSMSQDSL